MPAAVSMRQTMVDTQLRTNKITDDRILAAMAEIPRESFVPEGYRNMAYIDEDIPLANGRCLMEPMIFARLVQAADIQDDDVVLDIGCATGYSAAVLGKLARAVVAVDSVPELVEQATDYFSTAGQDNVVLEQGVLTEGWQAQAPYDVILVNGAVETVPDNIVSQLADGGRLCAVVRSDNGTGRAELMIRSGDNVSRRVLFDANIPPLNEFATEKGFTFE